jgi:hypothetical protein
MSHGNGSTESAKPRLCERCGKRMPPQKRGRPRRWCSQQCRQSAYEERHDLASWKDKQPKVSSLSEVVEVMSDRGARRSSSQRQDSPAGRPDSASHDCVGVVCANQAYMALVVDDVAEMILDMKPLSTSDGRFLARAVARLVESVHHVAFRVVPTGLPVAPTESSPERYARNNWRVARTMMTHFD